ncbi:mandelate racemase/muconate lactonizing enzyme family protein [Agrobacterium rhizogenes]|nr:mandelate racemase/muconate lactonizing enzyme family protein [Rhizobium rhizogenes]NTH33652.1 mandelate racemase/muconate lactonizing enzyme family protein [Rhizobium rhizogenes]NTH46796.1 mandelate racemase/muconate lactonizing enzyme family protein [Rhizobium rhizogenes]NTH60144.1 mandelate racemase/muconate lactonizing enzyme family protein [Rhizobium rhizogenes]NTH91306.1 mandelate racemase/muconate lactonizing enzyme family protein [Rhizobium rhizogenes]
MQASLHRAMLSYGGNLMLHTASSGPITGLDTLYLCLRDGDVVATGEVRINIAYLNGLQADTVLAEALSLFDRIDWSLEAADLLADETIWAEASAPVRMLLDIALHDLLARRQGVPLAQWLGAATAMPISHPTNQTLFISTPEQFLAQAENYVRRGFCDLKVRIGAGAFEDDLWRLSQLRSRFGEAIKLAVDANGAWGRDDAEGKLARLAEFDLAYVEQPIPAGDFDLMLELARKSPMPLMLDESVSGLQDVEAIIKASGRLWAHLKLVKLGGIAPTLKAAVALRNGNIPFMLGQMNEGTVATAAALHLACATGPSFAELYGADGLADDPASGLFYERGQVTGTQAPGLGLTVDLSKTSLLKEFAR